MNWETQLKDMVGKSFRRHGETITLHNYHERTDGLVDILTDVDDYAMPPAEVPAFLATFQPAVRPAARIGATVPSAAPATRHTLTLTGPSNLSLMQQALMDALARVQTDPDFVPQAEQVGRLVQTGINLAKIELEVIRLTQ